MCFTIYNNLPYQIPTVYIQLKPPLTNKSLNINNSLFYLRMLKQEDMIYSLILIDNYKY